MGRVAHPEEFPKYRQFDGKKFTFDRYAIGRGAKQELQRGGKRAKNAGAAQQYRVVKYKNVRVRTEPDGNYRRRTVWVRYVR